VSTRTSTDQVARTRLYRAGRLEREDFPVAEVSDYVADSGAVVWVDLCAPDTSDLTTIAEELGLHRLAVEDAVHPRQRPKLDRYATHDFLNMYDATLDKESGELHLKEISAFVTTNALVTVRKSEAFDIDDVIKRWDESPDLIKFGVGGLLYGLIDHVVDGHFETVEEFDERVEKVEDLLFDDRSQDMQVQKDTFDLRKNLATFRRVVLPMREVVNTLMRRDLGIVPDDLEPYYQDVYDHVLRATEWTESLRDLVSTILETNLTIQGNRLNIITKKVTSWAAIIAVPTAITGFYGQNLPYPGFATHAGLLWSCGLIVGGSIILYVVFKKKNWL
jgi:magnesium transporter